jgi:hypothetical protein
MDKDAETPASSKLLIVSYDAEGFPLFARKPSPIRAEKLQTIFYEGIAEKKWKGIYWEDFLEIVRATEKEHGITGE